MLLMIYLGYLLSWSAISILGWERLRLRQKKVYEGATGVDFTITFEATGPMYDSYIHIRVPETLGSLSTPTTDREYAKDDSSKGHVKGKPSRGYVRVSGTGSVRLGIGAMPSISIVNYDTAVDTINSHDYGYTNRH